MGGRVHAAHAAHAAHARPSLAGTTRNQVVLALQRAMLSLVGFAVQGAKCTKCMVAGAAAGVCAST